MIVLALGLLTVGFLLYLYVYNSLQYWAKRNVPTLALKFPYGNLDPSVSFGVQCGRLYNQFKAAGNRIHGGIYILASPSYMPFDIDIIKNILVKDHAHFMSRGMYTNPKQPMSEHVFSASGEDWKFMRAKLSPTFTSGRLKMMFEILDKCSTQMLEKVDRSLDKDVDVKDAAMRYTMDVIGNTAFGLECNSFGEADPTFLKVGLEAVRQGKFRDFMFFLSMSYPNLARAFNFHSVPPEADKFYSKIVDEVCDHREETGTTRNDFMQLLIELTHDNVDKGEKTFTRNMIKAQAFVFFLASFETSSSTMTFALYELVKKPELQDRVRKEIRDVLKKYNGKFTYDGIMEMKYLTQIVDETLRKYPTLSILNRQCTATYREPKTGLVIEKGTNVVISLMGIHYDPDNFPNPEDFDPERFSDENKQNIKPYTYMPFGEGNMLCIGKRFGLMQTKLGLAKLLEKYSFAPSKTVKHSIEFTTFLTLVTKHGLWLDIKRAN